MDERILCSPAPLVPLQGVLGSWGTGAAAGCNCCVRLGAWVLVPRRCCVPLGAWALQPLQGAATLPQQCTVDEEQPTWSFLFKSYLAFVEEEFMNDLEHVEKDLEQEEDVQKGAKKLYAYLVSFVKGRPLPIVRSVTDTDGFRAWQGLCREFQPKTRQGELGIIQALVAFPQFEKGTGIMKYEKLVGEYERLAGIRKPLG
eukprot:g23849.t1